MSTPFISYYQHIAKLSRVANKQTLFLAHLLSHMYFDKEIRQYIVDMSPIKKDNIMREVSPDIPEHNRNRLANQYLNKLKRAGLINNFGRGAWMVDPLSYGQYKHISHGLRQQNAKIFESREFTSSVKDKVKTTVEAYDGTKHELDEPED